MTHESHASGMKRVDSAARIIKASPHSIYRAFVDSETLVRWLPPEGMTGHISEFDPRAGGAYRMTLTYLEPDPSTQGKSTDNTDVIQGRFLELVPDERIVQSVVFQSDDPAFAGEMLMTWSLAAVPEGTAVSIVCENVPEGIRKEDHDVGLRSTLENLAACTE